MQNRAKARQLAKEFGDRGDALGWFEALYSEAEDNWSLVPWADLAPNPHLLSWHAKNPMSGARKRALNIGCGLGDDAEKLTSWGLHVVAFDISLTAISACRRRFPKSSVDYCVADLFNPPGSWTAAFDFVFEAYTLQVLPETRRPEAFARIASFVAPRGRLLVIARGRDESDPPGEMPWPLTEAEVHTFQTHGLTCTSSEDFLDTETPPVRRFRICYERG